MLWPCIGLSHGNECQDLGVGWFLETVGLADLTQLECARAVIN